MPTSPIFSHSGSIPRPPGLYKSRPVDRSHPVGGPPAVDESLRYQTSEPETIGFWGFICTLVVLFLAFTLLFRYDPMEWIIDIDSAERHVADENATLAIEKEKMGLEREMMAREKELWEKASEAHVPHGAFWGVVWPSWVCLAYGKREYWGSLHNIPKDWDAMDACMNMPVEIKGVKIRRPDRCANVSVFPEVQLQGFWTVDWDQPDCKPWYRNFEDKGCVGWGSGKRRIKAQIVGINNKGGQDWRWLCNSMPLVWDMITYPSPARCEEEGFWGEKFAVWEVPDETCQSWTPLVLVNMQSMSTLDISPAPAPNLAPIDP